MGGDATFHGIQYISHIMYVTHHLSKQGVWASRCASAKNPPAMQDEQGHGLDPWSGGSPGEGHGTLSSVLAWRIPGRGAWRATVHGVTKSWTRLSKDGWVGGWMGGRRVMSPLTSYIY